MAEKLLCAKCQRPLTYVPPLRKPVFGGETIEVGEGRYECDHGCLGNVDPRHQP